MTPPDRTHSRLDALALRIAGALAAAFDPRQGFGETEFYGTAFACQLWHRWPERFADSLEAGLARLKQQDKRALIGAWQNGYHWEFVRFALANLFRHAPLPGGDQGPATVRDLLGPLRFRRTRVANWILLRSTVRIAEGGRLGRFIGRLERRVALSVFQQPGGFIEDQRGAPTLQYHAFMTALLGHQILVLNERSSFLEDHFRKALEALLRTALYDGEVNAAGRGAFQSFGYAAACLALAEGLRLGVAPEGAAALLRAVIARLETAIGADGTLPLMLSGAQAEMDPPPTHPHQRRIGWHSYNNGPDYLAFSGAVLALAADALALHEDVPTPAPLPPENELADGIRSLRNARYAAVVTLPHPGLTPSQPLPYIVTATGERPLAAYGGEKLPESIYGPLAFPLPVFEDGDGALCSLLTEGGFRWEGPDKIVGESAGWRFERRFAFEADRIGITDAIILAETREAARLHLPWLPLPHKAETDDGYCWRLDGAELTSDLPLTERPEAGAQYGVSGRLHILSHAAAPPLPGEVLEARYRIILPA